MVNESAERILENQKTKFRCLNRVYDLTKELEQYIDDGDMTALELTVETRQKQLEVCASMDEKNESIRNHMSPEDAAYYFKLIDVQEHPPAFSGDIEKEIYSMTERIGVQLHKTIDYDKKFTDRFKR
jgi:hypothetical protein